MGGKKQEKSSLQIQKFRGGRSNKIEAPQKGKGSKYRRAKEKRKIQKLS